MEVTKSRKPRCGASLIPITEFPRNHSDLLAVDDRRGYGSARNGPMLHNRETRVFAPTQNARLDELLMLFDCTNEIAPFDADALATKAGELIAKVVTKSGRYLQPRRWPLAR
jgi:hypothetical protein